MTIDGLGLTVAVNNSLRLLQTKESGAKGGVGGGGQGLLVDAETGGNR